MTMKEIRQTLSGMGVKEERRGNNFIFTKGTLAATVKQKTELGHIFFYEKRVFLGEECWMSVNPEQIINYFKEA